GCAGGGFGGGGVWSASPVSAARVAAKRSICCTVRRSPAGGAAHPGAASRPRASGDGRLDRDADPCGRYTHIAALAFAAFDDAMGEPARQLHVRSRNDRAYRVRRALARGTLGAFERPSAMDTLRL